MRRLELAERVIELRERAGLTQEAAAKKAGVGATTWSNIETGAITRPHARTLIKMARALGVTPAVIMGEALEADSPKAEPLSLEWALDPSVSDEEYRAAMAQASVEDYTRIRRQLRQQGQWVEVEPARIGDAPRRMKVLHPLVVERLRAAPPITLFRMEESDEGNRCYWYIPPEQREEHRETVNAWFGGKSYEDVDAREAREGEHAKSKVRKEATVYAAA